MTITCEIEEGVHCAGRHRHDWDALFASSSAEPSTSYEWTHALARSLLAPRDRFFLITLRRAGRLVAVLPLVYQARHRLGRTEGTLTPLSELYNTHSDLLAASADPDLMGTLVDALGSLGVDWDTFRMSRLLQASPLTSVLRAAFTARGHWPGAWSGDPAYLVDLPGTFDAYLDGRSPKFRRHLRRMTLKLEDAGLVEVDEVTAAHRLEAGYQALLEIERGSWKQANGSSITAVGAQEIFYRALCEGALPHGRLHLHWLMLDGRPIAYNLGYLTTSGYHYLKTSYVHEYRPLGPATVLRARLFETLIARGVRRLDFSGEPYDWEARWATTLRHRVALAVHRPTARGCLLAVADRLRHRGVWRHQAEHDPPPGPNPENSLA